MYLLSFYMKANRQDKIYRQKEYRKKQKREKKLPSKNSNLDCEALCSDCTKSEAGVWSSSILLDKKVSLGVFYIVLKRLLEKKVNCFCERL